MLGGKEKPVVALEDRIGKQSTIATNRVRSIVRLRPQNVAGETESDLNAVQYDISSRLLWVLPGPDAATPERRQFDVDGMIGPEENNSQAFAQVSDTVDGVFAGTPGCIVAYGSTRSGKTHTLFDPDGMAVQAARYLFAKTDGIVISLQFVEVYMEMLKDLLDAVSRLTLREAEGKTRVHGTAQFDVSSSDDVADALAMGLANRHADQARATVILIMNVSPPQGDPVNLFFVDLPGSEGLASFSALGEGRLALDSTCALQSLSTFTRALSVVADKKIKTKPPLRESKLTRVLSNAFHGGARMSVICCVALGAADLEHTLSTLEFAHLAMRASLKESKNEKGLDNDTITKDLQAQIDAFDDSQLPNADEVEQVLRDELARVEARLEQGESAEQLRAHIAELEVSHSKLVLKVGASGKAGHKAVPELDPEEERLVAESQAKIKSMRAQVDAARKLRDEVTLMLPEIAAEYRELGGHAWHNGDTGKTETYYVKALAAYTKCMGKDHPEVACSMGDLANVYCDQARFDDAIGLYQQALRIHTDAFGPDHVDTAGDLASLGLVYSVQGNHKDALPLLRDAYTIMEKHLEDDHPNLVQVRTFMDKTAAALKK